MTQYLADTGLPFTDRDAAELKAERMSEESGIAFDVVPVDGGYALEAFADDLETREDVIAFIDKALQELTPTSDDAGVDEYVDEYAFVASLRPAWRAQYAGFSMMLLGLLLVIAPTWPIALFSMEAVTAVNTRFLSLWDNIALLGIALVLFGTGTVLWWRFYQHSVIAHHGVMQSVGIVFNRHISQIAWINIHVVDVKQPHFIHMLLNIGTVELSTPGSSGADVAIVDVVAPKRIATFIRERVDIERSLHQHVPPSARNRT